MTIVVTGATGNVGRPLVSELAAAGARVLIERGAGVSAQFPGATDVIRAAAAFQKSRIKTDYYNAQIHGASFQLPEWIKRLVP